MQSERCKPPQTCWKANFSRQPEHISIDNERLSFSSLRSIGFGEFLNSFLLTFASLVSGGAIVAMVFSSFDVIQDTSNAFQFQDWTDLCSKLTFPCRRQPLALISAELPPADISDVPEAFTEIYSYRDVILFPTQFVDAGREVSEFRQNTFHTENRK